MWHEKNNQHAPQCSQPPPTGPPNGEPPSTKPPTSEPAAPKDPIDDEAYWDAFIPDDDECDPLPEPGDFWIDSDGADDSLAEDLSALGAA